MTKARLGNKINLILIFLCCGVLFLLTSCAGGEEKQEDCINVSLMPSKLFEIQNGDSYSVSVKRDSWVIFTLIVKDGYYVSEVDYPDATLQEGMNGITQVILPSVKSSARVRVTCEEDTIPSITYDANGGEYINTEGPYKLRCNLNGHIRANTAIGTDEMTRDGYTLIGWNTEADGSGISIGLGSRCDVVEAENTNLYAQWEKWTTVHEFEITRLGRKQTISAYHGNNEVICVPEMVDGLNVTTVARGAFVNCSAKTVMLPKTIETVEEGAFENCAIEEIYFFDNLMEIGDSSFVNCPKFSTVHINAILSPGYANFDRHSNYADKVDLLRKHKDKKKIVLFGGCGVYFSIESPLIYEAFDGEYEVVNMGLNGWFSGPAQAEVILSFLQPGDILLHIPEMASDCQLFSATTFYSIDIANGDYDDRYMRTLEMDYDILSLIDIRETSGFFDSYARYNEDKAERPQFSYSANAGFVDEYGDYALPKPARGTAWVETGEAAIRPELLTETSFERLNRFYSRAAGRGARVFVDYAAVNRDALIARDNIFATNYLELAAQYEQLFESGIKTATVIGKIADIFYPGIEFFDTDWHLSDDAAIINTQKLIEKMKNCL